jgi:pyrroloquinoline quinone (PQQ) biosynthesis protein C
MILKRFSDLLSEEIFKPKGLRNWWRKMDRESQVKYRRKHPFTKKKARLTDIEIDRETLK